MEICTRTSLWYLSAAALIAVLLTASGAAAFERASEYPVRRGVEAQGPWLTLPIYNVGLEIITEGTNNYPLPRTLRRPFPLDMDITIMGVFGYDGDKLILEFQDQGETGDRIFAVALAQQGGRIHPFWGTFYSSSSQKSFEITIPVSPPGMIVYLFSGFLVPSADSDKPYAYTINVSYPQ